MLKHFSEKLFSGHAVGKSVPSLLIILLVAGMFITNTSMMVKADASSSFGDYNIGTSDGHFSTGGINLQRYITPLDMGNVTNISIYLASSSVNEHVTAIIMPDYAGRLNNTVVVASSSEVYNPPTSYCYFNFSFSSISLKPLTAYWFGFIGDGNIWFKARQIWNDTCAYNCTNMVYSTNPIGFVPLYSDGVTMGMIMNYTVSNNVTPNPLFYDGFETNDFRAWSELSPYAFQYRYDDQNIFLPTGITYAPTITSAIAHHGLYALNTSDNSGASYQLPTPLASGQWIWVNMSVYFSSLPTSDGKEVTFLSGAGTALPHLFGVSLKNYNGNLGYLVFSPGGRWVGSAYLNPASISNNTWYTFVIGLELGVSGHVAIYRNNVLEMDSSIDLSPSLPLYEVSVGTSCNGDTDTNFATNVYIDDVVIDQNFANLDYPRTTINIAIFHSIPLNQWANWKGMPISEYAKLKGGS